MGLGPSRALDEAAELGGWRSNGAGMAQQQHSFLLSETPSLQAGHTTEAAHTSCMREIAMNDLQFKFANSKASAFLPSKFAAVINGMIYTKKEAVCPCSKTGVCFVPATKGLGRIQAVVSRWLPPNMCSVSGCSWNTNGADVRRLVTHE